MNFRLIGLTLVSSVFVILYMFGDGIAFLDKGANMDQLLVPLMGTFGYYLFEIVVPFASILLIFFSLREAYLEGKREGRDAK
jgi:uncharacterized membrane protein